MAKYLQDSTDIKINEIGDNLQFKIIKSQLLDLIYPIGSIYLSTDSNSPSTYLGGTWERIKDKFLLSAGDSYSAGSTGGEETHKLTIDEMPKHKHGVGYVGKGANGVYAGMPGTSTEPTNYNNELFINYAGGSQPHNNMPPYLAVYVWKRTA